MLRHRTAPLYLLFLFLVAACSSATAEPPATAPTLPPTEAPAETTAAPPADEQSEVITAGQTGNGLFFRGRPDAPVTMIDYSDFQ